MIRKALHLAVVALALSLVPALAVADPVTLKLSFFTSDRSNTTSARSSRLSKPSTPTVLAWCRSRSISVAPSVRNWPISAKLVLDGAADLAFVVPGIRRNNFQTSQSWNCPAFPERA